MTCRAARAAATSSSRNSSSPGVNSSSSGMRVTVNAVADVELVEGDRVAARCSRARDRVAVRAGGGSPRTRIIASSTRLGDDVLPLARLVVGLGPRQPEDVGEEPLGQAVAAHDALGEPAAVGGEADASPSMATRPSCSMRRIISDTAGRETSSRSAMRAWMTSTSSSAARRSSRSTPRRPGGTRGSGTRPRGGAYRQRPGVLAGTAAWVR